MWDYKQQIGISWDERRNLALQIQMVTNTTPLYSASRLDTNSAKDAQIRKEAFSTWSGLFCRIFGIAINQLKAA